MSYTRQQAFDALEAIAEALELGPSAGESLNDVRRKMADLGRALNAYIDTEEEVVALNIPPGGNSELSHATYIAPAAMTIKSIQSLLHATPTNTPLLTLNNRNVAGSADRNPIAATNVDLATLTANAVNSHTLSSTAANLEMAAGDYLKITVTNDGSEAHRGISVIVRLKYNR